MTNVILCGGQGTRLWPVSRENYPKQFLKIFEGKSLFQMTVHRNSKYCDNILIVSNAEQYFLAQDQINEIGSNAQFIVETIGRDTAAAITFSALSVNEEEILFVTPSDAMIEEDKNYKHILETGKRMASEDFIITFGITPTKLETGYGYIEAKKSDSLVMDVLHFKEKPDIETAKKYIKLNTTSKEKKYFWNSGMFMFKAKIFLEELQQYAPEIYENAYQAFQEAKEEGGFKRIPASKLEKIPKISIDYALMEKSRRLKVVKSDIQWSDVGSFDALDEIFPKDESNNTKRENLTVYEASNNFVFGKYKEIALFNVEDLIIVDTPSALLVGKKGMSQNVKKIVEELKKKNPQMVKFGRSVYRPWGKFVNLVEKDGFKVKRIVVNPGKRLSLQKHYHRSEHWVVVKGTALVQIDEKEFLLRPNESTYIPIGAIHRLTNVGKISLEVVEVQVGEYLGEDDIVRYEDDFFRIEK